MNNDDLVGYVARVQARTREAAECLAGEHLGYRPRPGEHTIAELVLHIAASRRMNARSIRGEGVHYPGHKLPAGATVATLLEALDLSAAETSAALAAADLDREIASASGPPSAGWQRVLGGFIEHEVHHRSQLCEYLSALGLEPPPLFGLHVEDLPR